MTDHIFRLADLSDDPVRIPWSPPTDELHMNVVVLGPQEAIAEHTNRALDVIITCLRGDGTVVISDERTPMTSGTIILIHRGLSRSIAAGAEGMVYTTVHRKREGLLPTVPAR